MNVITIRLNLQEANSMNGEWLAGNADAPIRYTLTRELTDSLMENAEVKYWLDILSYRVMTNNLGDIHGSHDYRYENIIGKCFILGLDSAIPQFDNLMRFFINFLDTHITKEYDSALTFGKMYKFRDYETILACYLPFLGYHNEPSVRYVAEKRINIVYNFTKRKRYDVYNRNAKYPGARKEWLASILDPALYADGNIMLPSIHDFILFAGMYKHLPQDMRDKIEVINEWIFDENYSQVNNSLCYYAADDPSYKSKAINTKIMLPDIDSPNILYMLFILSHFETAKKSAWFTQMMNHLDNYRTLDDRYKFPKEMLAEKKDAYVTSGGHMNVGESKRNRLYSEILSTYWMDKINL